MVRICGRLVTPDCLVARQHRVTALRPPVVTEAPIIPVKRLIIKTSPTHVPKRFKKKLASRGGSVLDCKVHRDRFVENCGNNREREHHTQFTQLLQDMANAEPFNFVQ